TAFAMIVDAINQYFIDKKNQQLFEARWATLQPEIARYVTMRQRMMLDFALDGDVYLTFSAVAAYLSSWQDTPGGGEYGLAVFIGVQLDSIGLSAKRHDNEVMQMPDVGPMRRIDRITYTVSSKIDVNQEVLKHYKSAIEQNNWLDDTIRAKTTWPEDRK